MNKLIVAVIFLGLLSTQLQERIARVDQQDLQRWVVVLQKGELTEKAVVVARLDSAAQDEQNVELIRRNFLPLLVEELRSIKKLRSHPPSKKWLYDNAEWLGEYQGSILFLLGKIADESAVDILVEYLHTGRGVADGLARIGMPAIPAILTQIEKGYDAIIPACIALEAIADNELKRGNKGNLQLFKDSVLPTLERLKQSVPPDDDITLRRLQKTTLSIQNMIRQAGLETKYR